MLYIDFETRSYCDLTASGSWRYAQDPTTEILCMAYAFSDTEPNLVIGSELPDIVALHIDMGGIVEAHNAMFERALWESICVKKYGWPEIKPEQWRCSAALCARWGVPRDLKTAPMALGLQENKDTEGRAIMLQLSKPRKTKTGLLISRTILNSRSCTTTVSKTFVPNEQSATTLPKTLGLRKKCGH